MLLKYEILLSDVARSGEETTYFLMSRQARGQYITCSNHGEYFSHFVIGHFGNLVTTISCITANLQWIYSNVEQLGGHKFVVKNTIIGDSINIQQDKSRAGANERHTGVDPPLCK